MWIGSRKGVLRYEVGAGAPAFIPQLKDVHVTSLYDDGSGLLVGTMQGLLRWDKNASSTPDRVLPDAQVHSLYKDGPVLLISTNGNGLFRLDATRQRQPESVNSPIGIIYRYVRNGPTLWMGAGMGVEAGLYRWNTETEEVPKRVAVVNTGYIHRFCPLGGTLWIGAQNGLFRINGLNTPWDDAQLQIISTVPETIYTGSNLLVQWKIGNFG
ncbi:MAG TPA: hypothetical protein VJU82_07125 [Acidobacteriaceae bacterium]|nr:hypothetical protein [Acidobacteriaceae bacterium]